MVMNWRGSSPHGALSHGWAHEVFWNLAQVPWTHRTFATYTTKAIGEWSKSSMHLSSHVGFNLCECLTQGLCHFVVFKISPECMAPRQNCWSYNQAAIQNLLVLMWQLAKQCNLGFEVMVWLYFLRPLAFCSLWYQYCTQVLLHWP